MGWVICSRNARCAAKLIGTGRMGPWPARDALPHDRGALGGGRDHQAEVRLAAAHQAEIDLGEQLGVEQGAVPGARGSVDVEPAA